MMLYKNACEKSCSLFAALLLVFSLSADLYAAPGDLDPTFGNGGVVITSMSSDDNEITDIEVQPDGKIVTAGLVRRICDGYDNLCNLPMRLAFINRYLPTGALDKSFGKGGKIIFTHKNGDYVSKIALAPDGKIVALGSNFLFSGQSIVFRYNANGTLDASFGTGGGIVVDFYGSASGVVIQPDSKIVVIGPGVVRYNVDGSLDAAFGTGGRLIFPPFFEILSGVASQPDAKIVVSGSAISPDRYTYDRALLRYNSNGTLDNTFGVGGSVITDIASGNDYGGGVALQPDGKILVSGSGGIIRYNTNGSIDTSFAVNGISEILGFDMTLEPDGKIVVRVYVNATYALKRLNPNGSVDVSFGTNGTVIPLIGVNALAVQPDGKILSGGSINQSGRVDAAIVRFSGE